MPGASAAHPRSSTPMLLFALIACDPARDTDLGPRGDAPAFQAPAPVLVRLTVDQYGHAIDDVLGVEAPTRLEPDIEVDGLFVVGAAVSTISPLGVDRYEAASYAVATAALADHHDALVPCAPAGLDDADCARRTLAPLARRLWRRTADASELERLVGVTTAAAAALGDFDAGLVYGLSAVLQSPNFLYRAERGEPDPAAPGRRRATGPELASRLSFLLWDSVPDAALLDRAESGALFDEATLAAEVDRMLADPRARSGIRALFSDLLQLHLLDDLAKDPTVFVHASERVGPSAKEQALRDLEWVVFDQPAPWTTVFTTRHTSIDPTLAAIYEVRAPAREGFAETWLPEDSARIGFLGSLAFLGPNAHAVSSSPTKRGAFIRTKILCQPIPSPPADVDTSIPEADANAPTMRDRIASHLEAPTCAGCHRLTDPIGLGLENFDGIGRWRTREQGAVIDASGDLDGAAFTDAAGLAAAIADHRATNPCLVKRAFAYANARLPGDADDALLDWHVAGFAQNDHQVAWLLRDLALSPALRAIGETP